MPNNVGDRVGAVISVKDGKVFFLGEGVYEGEFLPPGAKESTPEEVKEMFPELEGEKLAVMVERVNNSPFVKNPRIKLDNGDIVWGRECWWGSVAGIKQKFASENFQFVNVRLKRDDSGEYVSIVDDASNVVDC